MKVFMGLGLRHLKQINMAHTLDLMVPASKNLTVWQSPEGGLQGGPVGPPSDFAHIVRFLAAKLCPIGTPPHDCNWTPTWLQGGEGASPWEVLTKPKIRFN